MCHKPPKRPEETRRDPAFCNGNCDNFLSKIWAIDTPYQAGFDLPSARTILQLNARTRAFTLQATTAGLNLKFMLQKTFFFFWTICPFAILESCVPVLTLCLLYHAHLGLYISCIHIFSSFFYSLVTETKASLLVLFHSTFLWLVHSTCNSLFADHSHTNSLFICNFNWDRIIVHIHWHHGNLNKTYLGALWQPIGIQKCTGPKNANVWMCRCQCVNIGIYTYEGALAMNWYDYTLPF